MDRRRAGGARLVDLGGGVQVVPGACRHLDAELMAGARDPGSDLAAVRDEDGVEHGHIRKMP
jgi:hypothetical protein